MRKRKQIPIYIFLLVFCLLQMHCGIYSFSGASLSPEVKTLSIKQFANNAPLINPTLSRKLTDAIREKFLSQTSLTLTNSNADLAVEGEITGYDLRPAAFTSDQNNRSALQRLEVSVNVRVVNKKDEKYSFETRFSQYQDFDASKSLSSVEDELITAINEALATDIFNKAAINW